MADALGIREPTGTGTATGGSSTTVVAANYPYRTSRSNASTKKYEGCEIYLPSTFTGTPNPNDISIYAPSTGTFTVGNAYASDTPASSDTFEIFLRGVGIVQIRAAINEALRQMRYRSLIPVTLVTDGDMAASGVGSWTASNATLTKVTNSNAIRGPQSLRVLATAAAGYAQSATIVVDPSFSGPWWVEALVRADVGTARLTAYDVTNSAIISSEDWTLRGWGKLNFPFTLPATCEALAFRLQSVANADDTYWNYLMAYPQGATELALPTWVTRRSHIYNVLEDYESDRWDWPQMAKIGDWDLRGDESNPNQPYKLWIGSRTARPLWLDGLRPYDTLSVDADTTFADRERLISASAIVLLRQLQNRPPSEETNMWRAEYRTRLKEWRTIQAGALPAPSVRYLN